MLVYDAVVLAGGSARRLDGADKPALDVGGTSLLDHVLEAVATAARVVVVGPRRPVRRPVSWALEQPRGAGPVAALAAGLPLVEAAHVVVLGADLPFVAPAVAPLLAAADGAPALLIDASGRRNHLAAAWPTAVLREAIGQLDSVVGASMRTVVASAPAAVLVRDEDGWGRDCDTWADVAAARTALS